MNRAHSGPIARGLLALAVLVVLAAPASAGEVAIVAPRTDGAAGEVAVVGLVVEAAADFQRELVLLKKLEGS